jgi:hypothetical protein
MACNNGCNDGCFDESIELQVGPTGATGAAGATGADGSSAYEVAVDNGFVGNEETWLRSLNGVSILYQSTAINSPATISNVYSDAISNISIPANTIGTVGDMLRLEILVQNDHILDNATIGTDVSFSMKITFDGDTVFDDVIGYSNFNTYVRTGSKIILDLVVSATDTLIPRTTEVIAGWGSRSAQVFTLNPLIAAVSYSAINTLNSSGTEISTITPALDTTNLIDVQLKNSDNAATSIASITSITIYKYLKS